MSVGFVDLASTLKVAFDEQCEPVDVYQVYGPRGGRREPVKVRRGVEPKPYIERLTGKRWKGEELVDRFVLRHNPTRYLHENHREVRP